MTHKNNKRSNARSMKLVLILSTIIIFLPILLTILWSFVGKWPWPNLLPTEMTTRTANQLLFGSDKFGKLLFSSISISTAVGILATLIGILTARATELYKITGRTLIKGATFLPILVPGTVLAMGSHVFFLKVGLADTITGIILIHIVVALPYTVSIMTDLTRLTGSRLEEAAVSLGASPIRAFCTVTTSELLPGILSSFSMAFILSYSQYFTTLLIGGGRVQTLALVLIPYIQSGDRALSSIYATVFVGSAILVFFALEWAIHRIERD